MSIAEMIPVTTTGAAKSLRVIVEREELSQHHRELVSRKQHSLVARGEQRDDEQRVAPEGYSIQHHILQDLGRHQTRAAPFSPSSTINPFTGNMGRIIVNPVTPRMIFVRARPSHGTTAGTRRISHHEWRHHQAHGQPGAVQGATIPADMIWEYRVPNRLRSPPPSLSRCKRSRSHRSRTARRTTQSHPPIRAATRCDPCTTSPKP